MFDISDSFRTLNIKLGLFHILNINLLIFRILVIGYLK